MNDRLEIASRAMQGLFSGEDWVPINSAGMPATNRGECRQFIVEIALAYADELIKQEALTRVKKEAEEHK